MSKIYTRAGDKGTTGTLKGRMAKSDKLPQALGALDELSSAIGLAREGMLFDARFTPVEQELKRAQTNLLIIGSNLAGSGLPVPGGETGKLERLIDSLTEELPKLKNFVYPVGQLHMARTIARRAERRIVAAGVDDSKILRYINRLSDALFVMARWVNLKKGIPEEVWRS